MLSLNAEENAHQVVAGLAAHRIVASEPSCSSCPSRWQRAGERAAVLRGGLKASRSAVLVYRLRAKSVRWAGRQGAGWFPSSLGKAAVLVFEAPVLPVCRSSVRCARPGKCTLCEGVG
jgi:hypothetical protein